MNMNTWITLFYGLILLEGKCGGEMIRKSEIADCKIKIYSEEKGMFIRRCNDIKESGKDVGVEVRDIQTEWVSPQTKSNRVLINSTFTKYGRGGVDVTLLSPTNFYPVFCARITSSHSIGKDIPTTVNVQLHCLRKEIKSIHNLQLHIKPTRKVSKRTARLRHLAVELPGCMLKEFKNSPACGSNAGADPVRDPIPSRPRFHVRQEGSRPSVRVTLSRGVYGPRGQSRDKELAYIIAIQKENGWGKKKRILKVKTLRWPKRNARFKHLEKRTTYQVLVWRRGEMKRYSKLINL